MKSTFKQYLFELAANETKALDEAASENTGHEHGGGAHIKADIVDILRSHAHGGSNEVLYSSLKDGKEQEFYNYYLNKLQQRYGMTAIKDIKLFRDTLTVFFHADKMKPGHFLKVSAKFPDEKVARVVYEELAGKYRKKV